VARLTKYIRLVKVQAFLAAILAASTLPPMIADASMSDTVVISHLQYGRICGRLGPVHVCEQTSDITITDDGTCISDHHPIKCTWYGYSFDYELLAKEVSLDCMWMSDRRLDVEHPDTAPVKNLAAGHFTLDLVGRSGHFVNPLFRGADSEWNGKIEEMRETCSYKGAQLFDIRFLFHRPEG
jgi:hypothetical protein